MDNVTVEQATRQTIMEQQRQPHHRQPASAEGDALSYHPPVPSISSPGHHNPPVIPQTTYNVLDDRSNLLHDSNGEGAMAMPVKVPKLNCTISDAYRHELNKLYKSTVTPTSRIRKLANNSKQMLSTPSRSPFTDHPNAANQGHLSVRSQSPGSINREPSPFHQGSPGISSTLPLPPTTNAISLGVDNATKVKTISPKDTLLKYHGPDNSTENRLPSLVPTNDFSVNGSMIDSNLSSPQSSDNTLQAALFNFLQQPPTRTPDLPASLTTIDSTKNESTSIDVKHSGNTSSDSGTFTCTYHGCTLQFETRSELQKHKRQAHQQRVSGRPVVNSQAGPHQCKQVNPLTGRPCNTFFTRPHDLTRHEDTVHNSHNQQIRCYLCKIKISRNDALARHMRVVHPKVTWPGKQRRKSGERSS